MKILMVTNTFTPHVGGVARSVTAFADAYRRRGHDTLVLAPLFENIPSDERGVIRVNATPNFNGSDFSVRPPIPFDTAADLGRFQPDIVHAHHPFLLGDMALRIAHKFHAPLVFTHHTRYEDYTHYVPGDSPALKRFVISLSTGYANLTDAVFAPSESIAALLRERGVRAPIVIMPTGVDIDHFGRGDGKRFRARLRIPPSARVVGHLGRLAPEKNLEFLSDALIRVLRRNPDVWALIAGSGPSDTAIRAAFDRAGLSVRLVMTGKLGGQDLVDAYHAMDMFAFASLTETQGMVLTEALAAGTPVVALDAPGAREVVRDGVNGRLIRSPDADVFAAAVEEILRRGSAATRQAATLSAQPFSMERTSAAALEIYTTLKRTHPHPDDIGMWEEAGELIRTEWELVKNVAAASGAAMGAPREEDPEK